MGGEKHRHSVEDRDTQTGTQKHMHPIMDAEIHTIVDAEMYTQLWNYVKIQTCTEPSNMYKNR